MAQLNKAKILDGATWRPPVRLISEKVVGKDGKTRVVERLERLCSTRHILALNPAGSVVFLVLGNANAMAEEGKVPYAEQILARKMAKGWLPYGRCPVAMVASQEISPRLLKNPALHEADPCVGGGWGPKNPCPHAVAERDYRTEKHNAKEAARQEAYKQEAERDRDQRDRHHNEMLAAIAGKLPTPAPEAPPEKKGK